MHRTLATIVNKKLQNVDKQHIRIKKYVKKLYIFVIIQVRFALCEIP